MVKENIEAVHSVIYLMGVSFVLGSFVTIFLLVLLDMTRKIKEERDAAKNETDTE
jgi:hypothetical protein